MNPRYGAPLLGALTVSLDTHLANDRLAQLWNHPLTRAIIWLIFHDETKLQDVRTSCIELFWSPYWKPWDAHHMNKVADLIFLAIAGNNGHRGRYFTDSSIYHSMILATSRLRDGPRSLNFSRTRLIRLLQSWILSLERLKLAFGTKRHIPIRLREQFHPMLLHMFLKGTDDFMASFADCLYAISSGSAWVELSLRLFFLLRLEIEENQASRSHSPFDVELYRDIERSIITVFKSQIHDEVNSYSSVSPDPWKQLPARSITLFILILNLISRLPQPSRDRLLRSLWFYGLKLSAEDARHGLSSIEPTWEHPAAFGLLLQGRWPHVEELRNIFGLGRVVT
jgi:hypothetical protein